VAVWPRLQGTRSWKQRYKALQAALDRCTNWARDWKMKWNIAKSNVVHFSSKRSRVTPYTQTLVLSGSALNVVNSYTYLGLVLQHNGSWTQHFERINSRTTVSSYLITRVNQRHGPPSPIIIRQLVNAMPRATILWALPFWKPTNKQYEVLNRRIVTPLRTALALPSSVSRAAVMVEFGMADIQFTRQQQILAYASRLAHCAVEDHLAKQLYQLQASSLLGNPVHTPDSFWAQLKTIEGEWECEAAKMESYDSKRLMIQRYFQQYQESIPSTSPPRPGLRSVKLQSGVSNYLYHDTKAAAVLRAKLRFDINGLQMGVVATRIASTTRAAAPSSQSNGSSNPFDPPDTRCQLCAKQNSDSRTHLLVRCATLSAQRSDLEFTLQEKLVERNSGSIPQRLRAHSYHCGPNESWFRFVLGELNCISASLNTPPVYTHSILAANYHRVHHARHLHWVRERLIPTKCVCCYPSLPIKVRLHASSTFLQQLFQKRFPGTTSALDADASFA